PAEAPPGEPEPPSWSFSDGILTAHCRTARGQHTIDLPGLAQFHFRDGSDEVRADARPGASPGAVAEVYRSHVLPFALQALGREVLHASGTLTPAGVVAWCAATGTGKSTLAYGLGRLGFPVWSD